MGKKKKRETEEPDPNTPPLKKARKDEEGSPTVCEDSPVAREDSPVAKNVSVTASPIVVAGDDDPVNNRHSLHDEQKAERMKMQLLVSAFSNEQLDQYELFRGQTVPKGGIRRIMQRLCGTTVPSNAVIAMAGITKVYVGEIVEAACQARDRLGDVGPLLPKHVREAVRTLKKKRKVPNSRYKRVFPFK